MNEKERDKSHGNLKEPNEMPAGLRRLFRIIEGHSITTTEKNQTDAPSTHHTEKVADLEDGRRID